MNFLQSISEKVSRINNIANETRRNKPKDANDSLKEIENYCIYMHFFN